MANPQLKKMCKNVRIARTAKVLKIVSESRLPVLDHNILFPVSLLAVVGFNWAALSTKQAQHLIHFVQTQGILPLLQLPNEAQPHAGLETQILLCQTKLFPFGLYICR